jgi:hypothetical protein
VSTVIVPFAPADGTDDIELLTVTWHFTSVGAVVAIDRDPQAADTHAATSATHAASAGMDERCGRANIRARRESAIALPGCVQ